MSFPPSFGKDEKRRRPSPAYAGPGPGSLSVDPLDSQAARLEQIQRHYSLHQSCPVRNPHDPTAPLFAPEQHPLPWRFKGNKRLRDEDDAR